MLNQKPIELAIAVLNAKLRTFSSGGGPMTSSSPKDSRKALAGFVGEFSELNTTLADVARSRLAPVRPEERGAMRSAKCELKIRTSRKPKKQQT